MMNRAEGGARFGKAWWGALPAALVLAAGLASGLSAVVSSPAQAQVQVQNQDISSLGSVDPGTPILMQADSLTYNQNSRLWSATGNVEANQEGRTLIADMVTYDEETGLLVAMGNVQLHEPDGPSVFADRVEIEGEFKSGIIEGLRLVFSEDSRMAAAKAVRTGDGITVLDKAVYSPCRACADGGAPMWQLKASRVVHDQENRTISYRNARFEIYGVPVVYLPYFSHPDPTVRRKTGILTPSIGNSTELGYLAQVPVFINLKPNMDLTLAPQVTSREGLIMHTEFRHRTRRGQYNLQSSLAYARSFNEDGTEFTGREIRGHLFGDGKFQLTPNTQWGYHLQLTTDDTYLRRFNISDDDRLTTNAYFRRFLPKGGHTVYDAFFFDGLRATDDDATTPIVPVLADHESRFTDPILNGTFAVNVNALSLFRTEGVDGDLTTNGTDTQRFSLSGSWEKPYTSRWGDVLTVFSEVRGDFYYTTDNETQVGTLEVTNPEGVRVEQPIVRSDDVTQSRFLGAAGVDWRWPWVASSGETRHVIEPIVQLIYSPYGGNPEDIPNEDSVSFEFDDTNLFGLNKFPGLDRWEDGPRANVGLRFATYGRNLSMGMLVGQTLRLRDQTDFPPGSGVGEQSSDYVGRFSFRYGDHVNVTHRFRLDRKELEFRRNEVDVDLDTRYVGVRASYISLDDQGAEDVTDLGTNLDARQEVRLEGRVRFTENWLGTVGGRRDLEDGEMINNYVSLLYRNECTEFEGVYRRRFTRDRDVEPETSVIFRVRLLASQ